MAKVERLTVGVHSLVEEGILARIEAVSAAIACRYLSPLIAAERKGDGVASERLDAALAGIDVLYGWLWQLPARVLERAPRLKWIQSMSAGVDRLDETVRASGVAIANVSGLHGVPIGEFVLQAMLMFVKQAPLCFRMKRERRYERFLPDSLAGKTVGIVGLGSIGREVARLAKAFRMRVLATRRGVAPGGRARHVDRLVPRHELALLLAESDFVVLAVPLTPETAGLVGAAELAAMKRSAYLINIARGAVVDEEALVRALAAGTIAGAALDVFAREPLPSESPLWQLPSVIFSPHVSGNMPAYTERTTDVFCRNLERYLDGRRLLHVVDKRRGY